MLKLHGCVEPQISTLSLETSDRCFFGRLSQLLESCQVIIYRFMESLRELSH